MSDPKLDAALNVLREFLESAETRRVFVDAFERLAAGTASISRAAFVEAQKTLFPSPTTPSAWAGALSRALACGDWDRCTELAENTAIASEIRGALLDTLDARERQVRGALLHTIALATDIEDNDPATIARLEALRARLFDRRGNHARAVAAIERARRIDSTSPLALVAAATFERHTGALTTAEALLDNAIAIEPHLPEAHYGLGYVALERGATADALSHFSHAAEWCAKCTDPFARMGGALWWIETSRLDESCVVPRLVLAKALLDGETAAQHLEQIDKVLALPLGDWESAFGTLRTLVLVHRCNVGEANPNLLWTAAERLRLLGKDKEDLQTAEKLWDRGLAGARPEIVTGWALVTRALIAASLVRLKVDDFENKAIALYFAEWAVLVESDVAARWASLAYVYDLVDAGASAVALIRKAHELEPTDAPILLEYARICLNYGLADEALRAADQYIAYDDPPQRDFVRGIRAGALALLGRGKEGLEDLRQLSGREQWALSWLLQAFRIGKQTDDAQALFEAALQRLDIANLEFSERTNLVHTALSLKRDPGLLNIPLGGMEGSDIDVAFHRMLVAAYKGDLEAATSEATRVIELATSPRQLRELRLELEATATAKDRRIAECCRVAESRIQFFERNLNSGSSAELSTWTSASRRRC